MRVMRVVTEKKSKNMNFNYFIISLHGRNQNLGSGLSAARFITLRDNYPKLTADAQKRRIKTLNVSALQEHHSLCIRRSTQSEVSEDLSWSQWTNRIEEQRAFYLLYFNPLSSLIIPL